MFIQCFLYLNFLCILSSCIDSSKGGQFSLPQKNNSSESTLNTSKSDTYILYDNDNQPFISAFLGQATFHRLDLGSNQVIANKINDLDSLLSAYLISKGKARRIQILRQALISTHSTYAKSIDSLHFLEDKDLNLIFSKIFNVDIEADPNELSNKEFKNITAKLDSLLFFKSTHSAIIKYINNEVFRYNWMRYEFIKVNEQILKCEYNAGGMAGSAHMDLYINRGKGYAQMDLQPLLNKLNTIMTRVVKERAYIDIEGYRFEIKQAEQQSMYTLECIVQLYSGATCCPPYVIRFDTKDFASFEKGSLHYATTVHMSNPSIKPDWKLIQ